MQSFKSQVRQVATVTLTRYSAALLWVVFMVVFGILEPSTFLSAGSLKSVLVNQVTIGMLSLALLVPLVAGSFDLSVGQMLAFGMVISVWISDHSRVNPLLAGALAIAICTILGFVNGFIVVRLRVNSFIATLGMGQVLSAATLMICGGQEIIGRYPSWFDSLTTRDVFGVSLDTYYLFGLALILWYVLEHTPIGRFLYATGGNVKAAKLAGVATDRLTWMSFVVSGGIAGFAGVALASRITAFSTLTGPSYLFPAFAAVFFGATQVKNRANVWGTIIAMYALAFGVAGLQLKFFGSTYWITPLFDGVALIFAVSLSSLRSAGSARAITRRLLLRRDTDEVAETMTVDETSGTASGAGTAPGGSN